jgi:hypothetical protein
MERMTPGVFCSFLAATLGWPEKSIAFQARRLRESDLLSKSGRGNAAAHVTSLDAARLLIAISCATAVEDTVNVVREFGRLNEIRTRSDGQHNEDLETALTRLIRSHSTELEQVDSNVFEQPMHDSQLTGEVSFHFAGAPRDLNGPKVAIIRQGPRGSIATGISGISRALVFTNHPELKPASDDRSVFEQMFADQAILTSKIISHNIIRQIGASVRS